VEILGLEVLLVGGLFQFEKAEEKSARTVEDL